ncbi:MAG TPA: hypothetical protein PKM27_02480 [Saprospiraceae bacterium]|nr:hypothetical protein [Saprospiraceae bacterium]HNT20101.1 hypothetical protein [Saprospiraceae bacterium]
MINSSVISAIRHINLGLICLRRYAFLPQQADAKVTLCGKGHFTQDPRWPAADGLASLMPPGLTMVERNHCDFNEKEMGFYWY